MHAAYATGAPCWFDVTAPDIPAAAEFYTALFGWTAEDLGPEAGHYTLLRQGDAQVAGIAPATAPDGSTVPAAWTPYFAVSDAAATVAAARDAGATVFCEPMDVFGQLTFAVLTDPAGATYAIAQLITHPGTQNWGAINGPCWVEYAAPGAPADAMAHYAAVFGWKHTNAAWETAAENPYQALSPGSGGHEFGGAHHAQPGEPAPFWSTTVRVADADAVVTRATELGGKLLAEPQDMPGPSRVAALADPAGAAFAIMSFGA
ncbi:VOC family protein [Nocardia lijiangensis]|uniref:VOC family protein n=1 Tax=Nocardia lijiangensis TaxID=299618 RepID=UPI0008363783|nr:VOC family protein [Nocardia lijiangensis]